MAAALTAILAVPAAAPAAIARSVTGRAAIARAATGRPHRPSISGRVAIIAIVRKGPILKAIVRKATVRTAIALMVIVLRAIVLRVIVRKEAGVLADKDHAGRAEGREIAKAEAVRRMLDAKVAVLIEVMTGVAAIAAASKARPKST